MKNALYTALLSCVLLITSIDAVAQPKHSLAFRHTWYNYLTPLGTDNLQFEDVFQNTTGRGIELAYYNRLFKNTFLVVPLKIGASQFPLQAGSLTRRELIGNLDLLLQHNFFKYGRFFNPFLHAGVGSLYNLDKKDFGLNFPVAIGLNIKLLDNLYASVQTQHRFSTNDLDAWHHGAGIHLFFGDPDTPEPPKISDRDGDGLNDSDDRCPDQSGPLPTKGCPDRDNDGTADLDDLCPDQPGAALSFGCPDTDNDGIVDKDDRCPDQSGPKSTQGCPDRDGDNIADRDDACPDNPGPTATNGCPDRDNDGVADRDDICPDKKGTPTGKGCPDTDGDGGYDYEDRCVSKPGPASNKGCPEVKPEDKAILANVVKNVQFKTGSTTLLQQSYPVLDQVAALMAKYPEYNLSIGGHTDSVGDDKFNLALSERRAKTCNDYLVKKGVPENRISYAGYGETRPVADNKHTAGRNKNRRVEFELSIK